MKRLYLVIGTLILVALLFLAGRAIADSRSPQQQQIDSLQQQAAGATDPAAAALLLEKAAPLSAAEAARATAQANAPQKSGDLCGLAPLADPNATPLPTVEVPRGISDWLQPPFSTQDVAVTNQWNDQLDGAWLSAYAGALGQDSTRGVVIAVDGAGAYYRFELPAGSGAARFTAADGLSVTVETAGGQTYLLDMAALTLTGEDGQAVTAVPQDAPVAPTAAVNCN
ncbi:MAG: hypothetical protein GYA20_11805 [Chloroflexi bacterium]|nr:hypothetical protein [Chloroflexota bacterium]